MRDIRDIKYKRATKKRSYINTSLIIQITAIELAIVIILPLCIN